MVVVSEFECLIQVSLSHLCRLLSKSLREVLENVLQLYCSAWHWNTSINFVRWLSVQVHVNGSKWNTKWRNVNCSQGCRHNEFQWLTDGFEGNLTGLHAQCDLMLHKLLHKTDYYLMLLMSSTLLSKQAALCWESLKSSRLRKRRELYLPDVSLLDLPVWFEPCAGAPTSSHAGEAPAMSWCTRVSGGIWVHACLREETSDNGGEISTHTLQTSPIVGIKVLSARCIMGASANWKIRGGIFPQGLLCYLLIWCVTY